MTTWRRLALPLLAGLGLFMSLSSWAMSSPVGSAPDDTYHLPTIWCSWGEHATCERASNGSFMVPQSIGETCLIQKSARSAACTYLQTNELTIAPHLALVERDVEKATDVPSQLSGNAVFHRVLRIFVGPDAAFSALLMRFVNIFIASLLFAWGLLVSRHGARRALALAWLVASVPIGMFIMSSTNPSSWAIAGVATYWVFLLAVLKPRRDLPYARGLAMAGLLCSAFIAVGSRADTLVFLGGSTVAVVLVAWKSLRVRMGALVGLGIIAVVIGILMVVTSIGDRLVLVLQSFTTSQEGSSFNNVMGWNNSVNHVVELPSFLWAFVGGQAPSFGPPTAYSRGLSWMDVGIPSIVGILMLLAVVSVVAWGFDVYNTRKVVAVGLALVVLLAAVIVPLEGANYGPEVVLQPRYFLPMLYVVIGLATLRSRLSGSPRILVLVVVVSSVLLANAVAQLAFLHRFTNGEMLPWIRLDLEPNWWWLNFPLSPTATWVIGVVGFLCFGVTVALISRVRSGHLHRKASQQSIECFEANHLR